MSVTALIVASACSSMWTETRSLAPRDIMAGSKSTSSDILILGIFAFGLAMIFLLSVRAEQLRPVCFYGGRTKKDGDSTRFCVGFTVSAG